jgi:nucleotide-binding universal stress UspA family protein
MSSEPIILVPLDGTKQALAALPVAMVLGQIEQAPLHILHVGEREQAGEESRRRMARETELLDGLAITTRVGTPAGEILQTAGEIKPRAIVMCKHSATEGKKMPGRTAMKVLHDAPCPVVLVPPERGVTAWHLHHVMVPHDGTPSTSAALPPAAQLAERGGAELLVVHVTDVGTAPTEPGSLTAPRYVDQPQHEWPAWAGEFVNRLACGCPLGHLHVRTFLATGNTASEILRLSKKQSTDLIVLAWRGIWEAPRAGTLKDILGQAHCPIMVVRTETVTSPSVSMETERHYSTRDAR